MDERRIRLANERLPDPAGDYVLLWLQAARRLDHNHALDHALRLAGEAGKPLVVYEGLRLDYPHASWRFHRFVIEGMRDNAAAAQRLGLAYWPFVETPDRPARGLLRRLAQKAVAIVTDDEPHFVMPAQTAALAAASPVAVHAVDTSSLVPLSELGTAISAAAHLRARIHRAFAESWALRAAARPRVPNAAASPLPAPFPAWDVWEDDALETALARLPIAPLASVRDRRGGTLAGRARLRAFVRDGLPGYASREPEPPGGGHASALSPYLHFGHVSAQEVFVAVTSAAGEQTLDPAARGKREGFWSHDPDVSAYLDQVVVWRDVGRQWLWHRREDATSLERALPAWALQTLRTHTQDVRPEIYDLETLEAGETGDPLWNAAQKELVATGSIHNALRMLWGKKVLEWSADPEEAYQRLLLLNDRYALDGRDPNSISGILWCFGLFDRPWPERKIFGTVRCMTSASAARKFDLGPYLAAVTALPAVADVRAGRA